MDNTAIETLGPEIASEDLQQYDDSEVVVLLPQVEPDNSPHRDLVTEIEAWARHALASSGFGDY